MIRGLNRSVCPIPGLAVLLVVAGCAGSMGTPRPGPSMPVDAMMPATGSSPVTAFDGSYQTTLRSTGSTDVAKGTGWCDSPGQPIMTIENGRFSYAVPHPAVRGEPATVFEATVAADGSFLGQVVAGSMYGTISGSQITGRIDGTGCLYAFSGERA